MVHRAVDLLNTSSKVPPNGDVKTSTSIVEVCVCTVPSKQQLARKSMRKREYESDGCTWMHATDDWCMHLHAARQMHALASVYPLKVLHVSDMWYYDACDTCGMMTVSAWMLYHDIYLPPSCCVIQDDTGWYRMLQDVVSWYVATRCCFMICTYLHLVPWHVVSWHVPRHNPLHTARLWDDMVCARLWDDMVCDMTWKTDARHETRHACRMQAICLYLIASIYCIASKVYACILLQDVKGAWSGRQDLGSSARAKTSISYRPERHASATPHFAHGRWRV